MSDAVALSTGSARARDRTLIRTLLTSTLANVTLGVTLVLVGHSADALSLVAEGWHSVSDALVGVIGLWGASLARAPADATHPYGRRKFELIAASVMGAVLLVVGMEVAVDYARHARESTSHRPVFTFVSVGAMIVVAGLRSWWAFEVKRRARRHTSALLNAEALHARADAFLAGLLVVSALLGASGFGLLDALFAAGIGVLIAVSGGQLLKDNLPWLADRALIPPEQVRGLLSELGVEVVGVRSRGTPEAIYLELRVVVHEGVQLAELFAMSARVRARLRTELENIAEVFIEPAPREGWSES